MKVDATKPIITIYLLFLESEHSVLSHFLKRGFGHVSIAIVGPDYGEHTDVLLLDTSAKSLNCFWLNQKGWEKELDRLKRGRQATWVKVTRYISDDKIFNPVRITPGCTAIANYALGFSNWTITPWGLYKKILKLRNRRDMQRYGILDIELPLTIGN